MAQSTAKANALMRDLEAALKLRFAGSSSINTVRLTADANNWPMLFLSSGGTESEGDAVILLRIRGVSVPAPDVFGNQQYAYSPHALDLAYEIQSDGYPIPVASDLFKALFESTNTGVAVYQYEIANGTAVTESSLNAASAVAELNNLYWPNKGV